MSLYTQLCSSVFFPIHEGIKGHTSLAIRRRLEEQERWPMAKLEAWRVSRLREFLVRIGTDVPYFREMFARLPFDPSRVRSIADLQQLPMMDKTAVRGAGVALKADNATTLSRYNTGGSTGEPLIFYIGKDRKSHDVAAKWRATRWWGVDIGDREVVVWGSPIELGAQDRLKQLRDRALRTRLLPAFEMSKANLDRFVSAIRTLRPTMLFGYPSALAIIAQHAQAMGEPMNNLGIKVAFVTSERLYDDQREAISNGFGCSVANGYGARDAGFIAHECPGGSLHLQSEDIIVEICDRDGRVLSAGEAGEIVVTHTHTHEFPFVRYRTGDFGVIGAQRCSCGRTLPVLSEIQGRATDFVQAADGTLMHGLALIYTVRDLPGVKKFKIVQHSTSLTEVLLVTEHPFNDHCVARIVKEFRARLGANVDVRVSERDDIPAEASGKYRYVVSQVSASQQPMAEPPEA